MGYAAIVVASIALVLGYRWLVKGWAAHEERFNRGAWYNLER